MSSQKHTNDKESKRTFRRSASSISRQSYVSSLLRSNSRIPALHDHIKKEIKRINDDLFTRDKDPWNTVIKNAENWDEEAPRNYFQNILFSFNQFFTVLISNKYILFVSLSTFTLLTTFGLAIVLVNANNYEKDLINQATYIAQRAENLLQKEIEKSFRPLFMLSSFVQELETFDDLPSEINETVFERPLSLPFITHRNVNQVCDNKVYKDPFNEIAENIKAAAKMQKILVNLQLAPLSVVCLLFPVNNTEDFEDGLFLDNTGALGHDLLTDPRRAPAVMSTITSDGVVVAGPLTLIQGEISVVKEAFIARLNVKKEGYEMEINNEFYSSWGLVVALLNWAALRDQIGLYELFNLQNMEFNITRLDKILDAESEGNNVQYKVVEIAASKNAGLLNKRNCISFPIKLTFNEWTLAVGFESGFSDPYKIWACTLACVISFIISLMLCIILVSKYKHKTLLYKTMPERFIKKLEKGEIIVENYTLATVFYSDIVGFTKMSGAMSPIEVMSMLNDMYSYFDFLVSKYKICKVETIGDAYVCIGAGPDKALGRKGAESVALFALDAMRFVEGLKTKAGLSVQIRAGISSGPVIACVIGKTIPKLNLFGDTCHLAESLEASSETMKIQCSHVTKSLLKDSLTYNFVLQERGTSQDVNHGDNSFQSFFITGVTKDFTKGNTNVINFDNEILFDADDEEGDEILPDVSEVTIFSQELNDELESSNTYDALLNKEILSKALCKSQNEVENKDNNINGPNATHGRRLSFNSDLLRGRSNIMKRTEKVEYEKPYFKWSFHRKLSDSNSFLARSSIEGFSSYWNNLAWRGAALDFKSSDELKEKNLNLQRSWTKLKYFVEGCYSSFLHVIKLAVMNPSLILASLLLFLFLCGFGVMAVLIVCKNYENSQILFAKAFAEDIGNTIVREVDKGLLSLFSLAEFIKQLNVFDSLAITENMELNSSKAVRNVSTNCQEKSYIDRFNSIARTIKRNSDMNETLLSLQLAPSSVVCLTYPASPLMIGYNILEDPASLPPFVFKSILSNNVFIEGPAPGIVGNITVDELLTARLSVSKDGYFMHKDNQSLPFWGFVSILLNWKKMKEDMNLNELFASENMEFKLSKNLFQFNPNLRQYAQEEVIMAKSEKFSELENFNSFRTDIPLGNEKWCLTVRFKLRFSPSWKRTALTAVVFISFSLAIFLFVVLVSFYEERALLRRMLPKHVIKKLAQGKTVIEKYESATISFTHMLDFSDKGLPPMEVVELLNEIDEEFDKIAKKCKVHKMEKVGDTYIVVGGLDGKSASEGAENVAYFALECLNFVKGYEKKGVRIRIRSGIVSGQIVAGVLGTTMPKYTIYGDNVNLASRMESTGSPMLIQCNYETIALLLKSSKFIFKMEPRVEDGKKGVYCKGKGVVETFWIHNAIRIESVVT